MKKIIALITIFILSFSSGYAIISNLSINLSQDELLKAEIFYIAGEGYTKDDNKLKKVEGIKFYSIAGQAYMKKDGEIIKMKNNRIIKINGNNYVSINGKLQTLDKYLAYNPNIIESEEKKVNSFVEYFNDELNITNLDFSNKKTILKIKKQTLEEVKELLLQINQNANFGINKWISQKENQTYTNFKKLKEIYNKKGDIELAKKFEILANIEKINIEELNINSKIENTSIKEMEANEFEILNDVGIENVLDTIQKDEEDNNGVINNEESTDEDIDSLLKSLGL